MKLSKFVNKIKAKTTTEKTKASPSTRKFVTTNFQESYDVQEYHNPMLGIKRD